MSRAEIKKAIQDNQKAAAHIVAALKLVRDEEILEFAELVRMLRSYILFKYRLDPAEALLEDSSEVHDLAVLAQLSLDKMQRIAPDLAAKESQSATCDGADSTTTKHALLLMAIQRDFEVEFNGFDVAFAESVDELAHLIWNYYHKGSAPDPAISAKLGAQSMDLFR